MESFKEKYIKKHGEDAWRIRLEKTRQWKAEHKKEVAQYMSDWREKNKTHISDYNGQYFQEKKYNSKYRSTKKGRAIYLASNYKTKDILRGMNTSQNIDSEWIIKNIYTSKCEYCGDSDWTHLGCDRIDNKQPHNPENCIPCCFICNNDRRDKYSVEEFKIYRSFHPRKCDIKKPVFEKDKPIMKKAFKK